MMDELGPDRQTLDEYIRDEVERAKSDVGPALAEKGFVPYHTGGGSLAWYRDLGDRPGEDYILVTNEELMLSGDAKAREWTTGRYTEVGQLFVVGLDLAEALEVAEILPVPTRHDDYRSLDGRAALDRLIARRTLSSAPTP